MNDQAENTPADATAKSGWWRFTLREMMIAIVAIAAVMALVARHLSDSFATTPFFDSFDDKALMRAACQRTKAQLHIPSSSAGTSRGGRYAERCVGVTIQSPSPKEAGRFVSDLYQEVAKALAESGCQTTGGGRNLDSNELTDFSVSYVHKSTQGEIRVFSLANSGDSWRLLILIQEFRQ